MRINVLYREFMFVFNFYLFYDLFRVWMWIASHLLSISNSIHQLLKWKMLQPLDVSWLVSTSLWKWFIRLDSLHEYFSNFKCSNYYYHYYYIEYVCFGWYILNYEEFLFMFGYHLKGQIFEDYQRWWKRFNEL